MQYAILSFLLLLLLLASGIPVYLSLGIVGIIGITLVSGFQSSLAILSQYPFTRTASYPLLVVPMFIMMGNFALSAGVSQNAYDIGRKWLSRLPGGLSMATTFACACFAAACGSSPATAASIGKISIPEMVNSGYDKKLATGCVAAGGCLGIMIPPSIILVLYGILTETSVGAMLIAGIIPGIITAAIFMIGTFLLILKNPNLAPPVRSYPWKERFSSLKGGWSFITLFLVVIGSIYFGVMTPTEAAVAGVAVSFIMMLFSKKDIKNKLKIGFSDAARTSAMIFFILVGAMFYSYFLLIAGVATWAATWISGLNVSPIMVVVASLVMYIPLGMFLEPVSILLITLPILHPIIVGLGFNSVWFGILVTMMIEIAEITPPVGLNVYIIAGVAPDVPLTDIFKGVSWFIVFELATLVLLVAFPILSIWLPSTMGLGL